MIGREINFVSEYNMIYNAFLVFPWLIICLNIATHGKQYFLDFLPLVNFTNIATYNVFCFFPVNLIFKYNNA